MSRPRPTLIARPPRFPVLLPQPPRPHPVGLPRHGHGYGFLNTRRDLKKEMDDLSEEERELDGINLSIQNRGFSFLVPMGRTFTQAEEQHNPEMEGPSSSEADGSGEVEENEDEYEDYDDLDARIEDLDEIRNVEVEVDENGVEIEYIYVYDDEDEAMDGGASHSGDNEGRNSDDERDSSSGSEEDDRESDSNDDDEVSDESSSDSSSSSDMVPV